MKLVKTALAATVAAISITIVAIVNARADVLEVGEGKAYSDIATAIVAANDHDTVLVYDGTTRLRANQDEPLRQVCERRGGDGDSPCDTDGCDGRIRLQRAVACS